MYNAYSTPKVAPEKLESHQPGVVLYLCESNTREVFVSEIVKVCQIHGDLKSESVNKRNRCKLCVRACNNRTYLRNRETRLKDAFEYREQNKEKLMLWQRDYRKENIETIKKNEEAGNKKRGYTKRFHEVLRARNLTKEQFDKMVKTQKNKCAICREHETCKDSKRPGIRRLSIDHCHKTGKTRGLLCQKCNIFIAYAKESYEILANAISYLRQHE